MVSCCGTRKKTQYFIAYKPYNGTNHDCLVRLFCLLEVPLCLLMAAKHILVFQTSPEIFRTFKENVVVNIKQL